MRNVPIFLAAIVCVTGMPVLAASNWAPAKKLDAYLDLLDKSQRVSAAISISEKGVMRYERVIGFATIERGRPQPADAGTRYRIGSVSGVFTAVLMLQLAENASISLDTPLAEFFPDIPNALNVTYRHLLAQRSGLADYTQSPGFQAWRSTPRQRADLLRVIIEGGLEFSPQERVEYSATNYLLLGYVLEKVNDRPFDELLRRRITEKLGLARTYLAGTGHSSSLEAIGYLPSANGWVAQAQTDPSVAGAASGMFSNATDLVRFMDALFARRLVMVHSVGSMMGGQEGEPGLGLASRKIGGQEGFGSESNADGFSAAIYHFPAHGLSIACTSNASELPIDAILTEALNAVLVRGYRPPVTLDIKSAK